MELETQKQTFDEFITDLERKWIRITLLLGITLVPIFGILDFVIIPEEQQSDMVYFWALRAVVTLLCFVQFLLLRFTPDFAVTGHGFFFTFTVGGMIAHMTTMLGWFDSSYYAGINLVIIAVNLLLPWKAFNGAVNGIMIMVVYVIMNLLSLEKDIQYQPMINNLYFMGGTVIISVTISHLKRNLTQAEFEARTALWGEMEIAKKIQTALLPRIKSISEYDISAIMLPASEVGGDYYDILETRDENRSWVCMGDVSGHGVEAGLIMMMTQTSVQSIINREPDISPSQLLIEVNETLKENISRLGENKYLTILALKLNGDQVTVSGKHQDILIYRQATGEVEVIKTQGFWLGISKNIGKAFSDTVFTVNTGDVILLYTDGVTELAEEDGEMYSVERLELKFKEYIRSGKIDDSLEYLLEDLRNHSEVSDDDISLMLMKKR